MSKDVFGSLTSTEKKIVKEYLRSRDISPKELAMRLNVSVRTVYKALYKYRRELKRLGKIDEAEKLKRKRGRRPRTVSVTSKKITPLNMDINSMASKAIYDAIYQYLMNILKEGVFRTDIREEEINLLIKSINELKRSILLLNQNILYLIQNMGKQSIKKESLDRVEELSNAPSFLIDNPWMEVLKERG